MSSVLPRGGLTADDSVALTPDPCSLRAARAWLWGAVAALLVAGLFAILLVLARTPFVQALLPGQDFFRTALVVHVNLSVLVWFLCMAGWFWSLNRRSDRLETLALGAVLAGVGLIVVSPFVAHGAAHLNNYIPTVESRWFGLGLASFSLGLGLQALRGLWPGSGGGWRSPVLRRGVVLSALVYLVALGLTLAAWWRLPESIQGEGRFELLFWGGGHVLQITHTLLLALGWYLLLQACGARWPLAPGGSTLLLALMALPAAAAPVIDWLARLDSLEYRHAYTDLMRYAGLASLPWGLLALIAFWKSRAARPAGAAPLRAALTASALLFAAGGVIGFLIQGVNVVIPAHYHGSIVGVTLAFMGVVYWALPRLGYTAPSGRLARWQPYVYGGGQLLHILGLAWSGGYGVQRKAAGAEQVLRDWPQLIGMGLMGLGGLIAVIGGILFLVVVLRALLLRPVPLPARESDG